ncbi:hypothetical protein Tco_0352659 [Tanacetum coccineum]
MGYFTNERSYCRFDVGLHEAMMSLGVGKLKDEVICTLAWQLTEVAAMAYVLRFATLLSLYIGVLSLQPNAGRVGSGNGIRSYCRFDVGLHEAMMSLGVGKLKDEVICTWHATYGMPPWHTFLRCRYYLTYTLAFISSSPTQVESTLQRIQDLPRLKFNAEWCFFYLMNKSLLYALSMPPLLRCANIACDYGCSACRLVKAHRPTRVGKLKDEVICTLARQLTEVAAMAYVLRFATLLSLYIGVLSLQAQRRSSRLWQWDQGRMAGMTSMGRMGDTGHLGGESLGRLGGQDMGCLGGQRMELSGRARSMGNGLSAPKRGLPAKPSRWVTLREREKGYDKEFQTPTHLDALGAGVSNEDQNHKFRDPSLPAWDSLAMTMRTKKNIDTLSIDDLYNNLSVFEQDNPKEHHLLPLHLENVLFLSQAKASSSKHQPSHCLGSYTSYTTSSSKATTTATPDLDQIDDLDLEEMDINWQIAMTAIKIKKFYKKIGRRPRVEWKKQSAIQKGSLGRVSVRGHDFISSQWRTEKEAYDDQLMKSDQLG